MSSRGPRRSYQNWQKIPPVDDSFKLEAACRDADPTIFFPTVGGHPAKEAYEYCQSCPVTSECLDYALTVTTGGYDWGIWGLTNKSQRDAIRKERVA